MYSRVRSFSLEPHRTRFRTVSIPFFSWRTNGTIGGIIEETALFVHDRGRTYYTLASSRSRDGSSRANEASRKSSHKVIGNGLTWHDVDPIRCYTGSFVILLVKRVTTTTTIEHETAGARNPRWNACFRGPSQRSADYPEKIEFNPL